MTLPIAGWYPDPQDSNRTRWWDGARWGALAPQPAATVPTPQWEPALRRPSGTVARVTTGVPHR
ncbi:DUF2510 domain-containing protein [Curtobacterium sp. PhB141]|uniref:DUF2510 domain-containing protein n=1 Tax=Curtobacterium sp. PhB141 TaxID=2485184 RepID=UPI000F4879A0|nr:DUF2510 domain-containing protein [Curtobacterium sp. PhB141]